MKSVFCDFGCINAIFLIKNTTQLIKQGLPVFKNKSKVRKLKEYWGSQHSN